MSNLLEKASIILTPTAYNDGKVLCVKPSDGTGDFDFSRNSAATRVNAQGLVENVQILSSNLIVNGDFATNSNWSFNTGWSYETNKAVSVPSGGGNGINQNVNGKIFSGKTYKIEYTIQDYVSGNVRPSFSGGGTATGTTNNGNGTFTQNLIPTANNTTFSIKATGTSGGFNGSITNVSIIEISQDTNLPRINYEGSCGSWLFEPQSTNLYLNSETLNTQTITTTANQYTVSFYGTGTITFSGTHTGSLIGTGLNDRVTETFTATSGTLTSTVSGTVTKAQAEEQSYATSYIPTSGSTVTRNQDVCNNGGSAASINSSEGVLYFEGSALVNGVGNRIISLSDGSNDNVVQFRYGITANRFTSFLRGNGSSYAIKTISGVSQTDNHKIALAWDATSLRIYVDGAEGGSVSTNDLPIGLNQLKFDQPTNGVPFFSNTKCLAVWKEALTDAELTALTTI